jgi:hypothetical protein
MVRAMSIQARLCEEEYISLENWFIHENDISQRMMFSLERMTHPYRPTDDPLEEILLNDTVTSNKVVILQHCLK